MRFTLKEASFQKLRKKDQNVSTLINRGGLKSGKIVYNSYCFGKTWTNNQGFQETLGGQEKTNT